VLISGRIGKKGVRAFAFQEGKNGKICRTGTPSDERRIEKKREEKRERPKKRRST